MKLRTAFTAFAVLFSSLTLLVAPTLAAGGGKGGPQRIGNFGPTGVDLVISPDKELVIGGIQTGSPAEGKLQKGEIIVALNGGAPLPAPEGHEGKVFVTFKHLAGFITKAEATDGKITFGVKTDANAAQRDVVVTIPVIGSYSKTAPLNCPKTTKIVGKAIDYITEIAGEDGSGLTDHSMYHGWAIISLLSTGEEKDLDVVRKIYKSRMADFKETEVGSHNWHNGLQGIAVCEYYLRTGDKSVMPLINAICESARRYQVHGAWSHWAKGINPQYTAGGHMNAAGNQVCTTLVLAKMCGAEVDDRTLVEAVRYFYRFAGHGSTPYGDHRPELGYNSNNGKTEQTGIAMLVARHAKNGEVYAQAGWKNVQTSLYNYPHILQGHTGGIGATWCGIASGWMAEKEPALYRNWFENVRWFYELSRRHTGAFGVAGAARYDQESYGFSMPTHLNAPLKTLQITGAPKSKFAREFTLPKLPWGNQADLAFFTLKGGKAYTKSNVAPHLEIQMIREAKDEAKLTAYAAHPEAIYRLAAASTMRDNKMYGLIEKLLKSDDPLTRHTAAYAINQYEPWGLRFMIGTRARYSLAPDQFSDTMFNNLLDIITDPNEAWWVVDQALLALATARTEQVKSRMDDILPWLHHSEWWINESACIALSPAMKDKEALTKMLPHLVKSIAGNVHTRPRGTMTYFVNRGLQDAPEELKEMAARAFQDVYRKTPSIPNPEPGVDIQGLTSCSLLGTLGFLLDNADPDDVPVIAQLAADRIADMRPRERDMQITMLVDAGLKLEGENRTKVGKILVQFYRPSVVGDDPAATLARMRAGQANKQMNTLLAIDRLAGRPGGWQVLGNNQAGEQDWWHTSFEPKEKLHPSNPNRYRKVELPERLSDWFKPDYDPAKNGWLLDRDSDVTEVTPRGYQLSEVWKTKHLPEAKEVIFVRKSFDLKDLDQAVIRLSVYSRQGYDVYLNGNRIAGASNRSKTWQARQHYFNDAMRKHLKPGKNVIAARSFLQYFRGKAGGIQMFVETLKEYPSVEK